MGTRSPCGPAEPREHRSSYWRSLRPHLLICRMGTWAIAQHRPPKAPKRGWADTELPEVGPSAPTRSRAWRTLPPRRKDSRPDGQSSPEHTPLPRSRQPGPHWA